MALELVSGAGFWCKLMSGGRPIDLRGGSGVDPRAQTQEFGPNILIYLSSPFSGRGQVNQPALTALDAAIKSSIERLRAGKVSIGKNGKHLLQSTAADWCFSLGALQLMRSNERLDPVHFDGGASFLHLGLTLAGERALLLRHRPQEDSPEEELRVVMKPGHVYLGGLCGPEHYVQHIPAGDLHTSSPLGPIEIAVLLRSACFRASRSSTQQAGPLPLALWDAVGPVVAAHVQEHAWLLPSLDECKAKLEQMVA